MADLTHGQMTRMIWIDARLTTVGQLNRSDLVAAFGISQQQASHDIRLYESINPGRLQYDHRARMYYSGANSIPAYSPAAQLAVVIGVKAVTKAMEAAHG